MNQSTTPSTPAEIVARQARLAPVLRELATFRYSGAPRVVPDLALDITDAEVNAWVAAHHFTRSTLAPHIAQALAYIDKVGKR